MLALQSRARAIIHVFHGCSRCCLSADARLVCRLLEKMEPGVWEGRRSLLGILSLCDSLMDLWVFGSL